jgi:hypothetical protein
LGIAIQQTLGIGLGYNFDHMSQLKKGEVPSPRRLQARAAKSALRRAQVLLDIEQTKDILDNCSIVQDQDVKSTKLRDGAKHELKYLADRLTELVPNDRSLSSPYNDENNPNRYDTKIEQYNSYGNYERTADNEYTVKSSTDLLSDGSLMPKRSTTYSPSIAKLLQFGRSIVNSSIDDNEQYYSSALFNVTVLVDGDDDNEERTGPVSKTTVTDMVQAGSDNTSFIQSSLTSPGIADDWEVEKRLIEESLDKRRRLSPTDKNNDSHDFYVA